MRPRPRRLPTDFKNDGLFRCRTVPPSCRFRVARCQAGTALMLRRKTRSRLLQHARRGGSKDATGQRSSTMLKEVYFEICIADRKATACI